MSDTNASAVAESTPVYKTGTTAAENEITARLNELYKDISSELDEDIQLAQYKLFAQEDW